MENYILNKFKKVSERLKNIIIKCNELSDMIEILNDEHKSINTKNILHKLNNIHTVISLILENLQIDLSEYKKRNK